MQLSKKIIKWCPMKMFTNEKRYNTRTCTGTSLEQNLEVKDLTSLTDEISQTCQFETEVTNKPNFRTSSHTNLDNRSKNYLQVDIFISRV